jgi:hypothetical protein
VIAIFKPQRENLSYIALSVRRFSSKKVSFSERNLKHGAIHTFDENKTHSNGPWAELLFVQQETPNVHSRMVSLSMMIWSKSQMQI